MGIAAPSGPELGLQLIRNTDSRCPACHHWLAVTVINVDFQRIKFYRNNRLATHVQSLRTEDLDRNCSHPSRWSSYGVTSAIPLVGRDAVFVAISRSRLSNQQRTTQCRRRINYKLFQSQHNFHPLFLRSCRPGATQGLTAQRATAGRFVLIMLRNIYI